jgi:sugar phosphate isomerase/epimerase
MKLGVITDGISEDLDHAAGVMNDVGAKYAELQLVWGKEMGEHTDAEVARIKQSLADHELDVSVISRRTFIGLPISIAVDSAEFQTHLSYFQRTIDVAKELRAPLVRIMTLSRVNALWGYHGFDHWMSNNNTAWSGFLRLIEVPVQIAADQGVTLCFETGTSQLITSGYLARKLVDDLGANNLKILWDVCNAFYVGETPFPDAYDAVRPHLAHIHIKDWRVDLVRSVVDSVRLGTGDLGPYLEPIAEALRADGYNGAISLESVFRPEGGSWEDGFRASWPRFQELFASASIRGV